MNRKSQRKSNRKDLANSSQTSNPCIYGVLSWFESTHCQAAGEFVRGRNFVRGTNFLLTPKSRDRQATHLSLYMAVRRVTEWLSRHLWERNQIDLEMNMDDEEEGSLRSASLLIRKVVGLWEYVRPSHGVGTLDWSEGGRERRE